MKKWSEPKLINSSIHETRTTVCSRFDPISGTPSPKIFDPDSVVQNCQACTEYDFQTQNCKYIGHPNAFCS